MKTISLKKVSAVAVASLGFGLLSVVPAHATAATTATVSAATTVASATATQTLGTITLAGGTSNAIASGDAIGVTALTGPVGGTVTVTAVAAAVPATASSANVITVGGTGTLTYASGTGTTTGTVVGQVSLPGVYTMTFAGGGSVTFTATGQANSIVPLVADGLSKTAANSTNGTTANGVAGAFNTVTVGVVSGSGVRLNGTQTMGTSGARTMVTVSGAGATITSATNLTIATDKLSAVTNTSNMTFASGPGSVVINTPTVGTVTVKSYIETGSGTGLFAATADGTVTITVGATALNNVHTAAASLAYMGDVATEQDVAGTDDVILADNSSTATAQAANITVTVRDTALTTINNLAVSAVITGPGLLGITDTEATRNTAGTVRVAALAAGAGTGVFNVAVWPDNTGSGTSTVTITAGTTVIATKTITWYGAAKTLTAGALTPHVLVSGANADAVWVHAKDDKGNTVPLTTPTALSSDTTVISSTLASCADASTAQIALGVPSGARVCDIASYKVGTATLTISPASTSTNSPTVALRVTKSTIASVALSTNKTTYAPGEKITLTLTAKDADGQLSGAGTYDIAEGASTASQALTGTAFTTGNVTINAGVASVTYYAPLITGPFTFTFKTKSASPLDTAAQTLTLTATAAVVDATQTALNTRIDSLNAKIVALTALIAKIMKSLKIK